MHPDFEVLTRFALREATVAEAREVQAHVRECPQCREEAREIALLELGLQVATTGAEPASPCPDAAEWAAFVDGALAPGSRQVLEQHLLGCDDCLHRVLLVRRSHTAQVPEHLIEQARSLRASPAPATQVAPWILSPVSIPRWVAAAVSLAAVVFMVLFLRDEPTPSASTSTPGSQQTNAALEQQQIWRQLTALKPEDGKIILLAVTPALRDSISAYQKKPDRGEQLRLLEQLQKLEPTLPAPQIQSVQLNGGSEGKTGDWVALQWKGSRLDVVSIPAGEVPRPGP